MNFLDEILEYFNDEIINDDLDSSVLDEPLVFVDNGSLLDDLSIDEVRKHFQLSTEASEEFLEITQSIQHSLSMFDDVELLSEIDNYIDSFNQEPTKFSGLINNIKGIYGEHEVYEKLKDSYGDNIRVMRDYATNTPDIDFKVFDNDGEILEKIQVKITSDADYVLDAREKLSEEIKIVTTDEAIEDIISKTGDLPDGIFGVDISNVEITNNVERTIAILSETEPEFELLIGDPVITEHFEQGINPFEESKNTFGRKLYSDWNERPISSNTYSNYKSSIGIEIDNAAPYITNWNPTNFEGVGTPFQDAIHWMPQKANNSCAIVTQRNILQALTGQTYSEEELCKYAENIGIYDSAIGTSSENLSQILQHKGLHCEDIINAKFADIEQALENGNKVMVGLDANEIWLPLRDINSGKPLEQPNLLHCIQLSGVDYSDPKGIKIIFADTGVTDGSMKAVSLEDFLNSWEDTRNRIIIVSK